MDQRMSGATRVRNVSESCSHDGVDSDATNKTVLVPSTNTTREGPLPDDGDILMKQTPVTEKVTEEKQSMSKENVTRSRRKSTPTRSRGKRRAPFASSAAEVSKATSSNTNTKAKRSKKSHTTRALSGAFSGGSSNCFEGGQFFRGSPLIPRPDSNTGVCSPASSRPGFVGGGAGCGVSAKGKARVKKTKSVKQKSSSKKAKKVSKVNKLKQASSIAKTNFRPDSPIPTIGTGSSGTPILKTSSRSSRGACGISSSHGLSSNKVKSSPSSPAWKMKSIASYFGSASRDKEGITTSRSNLPSHENLAAAVAFRDGDENVRRRDNNNASNIIDISASDSTLSTENCNAKRQLSLSEESAATVNDESIQQISSSSSSLVPAAMAIVPNSLSSSSSSVLNAKIASNSNRFEYENQIRALTSEISQLKETETFLRKNLNDADERSRLLEEKITRQKFAAARAFEVILREKALADKRRSRSALKNSSLRLGHIVVQRTGPHAVHEIWRDGYELKDLQQRQALLLTQREALEREKKQVESDKRRAKNRLNKAKREALKLEKERTQNLGYQSTPQRKETNIKKHEKSSVEIIEDELAQSEREEVVKVALGLQKKKEEELSKMRQALESEKRVHMKELKRCRDEDASRFNKLPVLNNRYLLVSLLGKGGFSEVWLAFDLMEYRKVACKVHQLNPAWSEERKQSYTKHATREYAIHKSLRHKRVVRLFDVFEIDIHSFATVLEHCNGSDLDLVLKERKTFPEKEARAIIMQVLSALKYLNSGKHGKGKIIHYDLKPGNILFHDSPNVKITDFGLSKIVDDSNRIENGSVGGGASIELTSQGAGTYWYLPPECFRVGEANLPRISSKVDVWSVGVIFYQMLFGKRPFGEGMSQERLVSERTMLNAREVKFPTTSKSQKSISNEAKNFIRDCLNHRVELRPDVNQICAHSYLLRKNLK
eukprot:g3717.t1